MAKNTRYRIDIESNFHIENFLGNNNNTNHSFFWLENHDHAGRHFYFSSTLLSNLDTANEIMQTAAQIVSLFQGIYTLLDRNRNGYRYFTIRNIFDLDANRYLGEFTAPDIFKIDLDFASVTETAENQPVNPIYILFEQICKDPFLVNLFFLLSNKVDYRMLYMILDDIKFYLKEHGDKAFLNPYKKQLDAFGHTANNYEVLGFYARHGRTSHEPPKFPVSLENSKNLIFDIITQLLQTKYNITFPAFWGMMYVDFSSVDLNELKEIFNKSKT